MFRSKTKRLLAQSKFKPELDDIKRDITHIFMDGGKVHIGEDSYNDFVKTYSIDVANTITDPEDPKYWNYICEVHTPIFNYYVDIDILNEDVMTYDKIEEIVGMVQHVVFSFLKKTHDAKKARVIVASSDSYEKNGKTKTGIHLVWPHIHLETCDALFLREALVQYFTTKVGKRPDDLNQWDDVFDEAVYRNSGGLRMIGSYKTEKCKECKGKTKTRKDSCVHCHYGKIHIQRNYIPILVMSGNERVLKKETAKIRRPENSEYVIRKSSIRTTEKSNVDLVKPYPKWFNFNEMKFKQICKSGGRAKKRSSVFKGIRQEGKIKGDQVNLDDASVKSLVRCIAETTNIKEYKRMLIRKISINNSGTIITIITDSHYCMNLGREHNGEHIYFQIKNRTLYQRCFCSCDTTEGRSEGRCKYYNKKIKIIPSKIIKLLKQNGEVGEDATKGKSGLSLMKTSKRKNGLAYKNINKMHEQCAMFQ